MAKALKEFRAKRRPGANNVAALKVLKERTGKANNSGANRRKIQRDEEGGTCYRRWGRGGGGGDNESSGTETT